MSRKDVVPSTGAALLALALPGAKAVLAPSNPETLIRDGVRLHDEGKYDQAIATHARVLAMDAGSEEALGPVASERMALRTEWVARTEAAADAFAACSLVGTLGSGVTHPAARSVQELHDELCRATSGLTIA
jgi:hypothetical protein